MKAKEIRDLSDAEIKLKLRATRDELLQLNLRKNTGQVEKPHMFRLLRKDIARMETILTQRKSAAAATAAKA